MRFEPVDLDPAGFAPLRLAGAWAMRVDDPRFGGVSAAALEGGRLIALTDAGTVIRSPLPGKGKQYAWVRDLSDGPGSPLFKSARDSEALLRDPGGRGWWVAFENRHQIWLFDRWFRTVLRKVDLAGQGFTVNAGIEGLAWSEGAILAFPERGRAAARITPNLVEPVALENEYGRLADAANLPDGGIALIARNLGPLGFSNRLVALSKADGGYRVEGVASLGLGRLDNAEAIAAQALAGGGYRLWIMTDNGFRRRVPTLLIALDWKPAGTTAGVPKT